ncbi:hypothetical protein ACNOYE_19175 [Nannocystaceae bacterium ST9]
MNLDDPLYSTWMSRRLPAYRPAGQSRLLLAGEPLVFHCNHYNYWLQHTLRLDPELEMDSVIRDTAESCARSVLAAGRDELGIARPAELLALARDLFAELGFGRIDFAQVGPRGGRVRTPTSHYGQMLATVTPGRIERAQNLFDQGFAAGAVGLAYESPPGALAIANNRCMSLGAAIGEFDLVACSPRPIPESPGDQFVAESTLRGREFVAPPASDETRVDEAGILATLAGLDFSGNEEGLIPRFGVILTRHFANFYNRISHEYIQRMDATGLLDAAEQLLVNAGERCSFNTFGGIMASAEWDALVRPQCQTRADWVHGMVAVVNMLGWGTWRVAALDERRVVIRIWDDYESLGWLALGGPVLAPPAYLATGGVAGMMGLIYYGNIADRPARDDALYNRACRGPLRYVGRQTRSRALGDPFTEIVAEATR